MAEEKKQEQNQEASWKNIQIDGRFSLNDCIQFINAINQRLCLLEDNVSIHSPLSGKLVSASDYQKELAEFQRQQMQRPAEEKKTQTPDSDRKE